MKRTRVLLYFCLCICPPVWAQAVQQPVSAPEQWQLTVEAIKQKVQALVEENNTLNAQYQSLLGQAHTLQQAIADQAAKNDGLRLFLKERNGKSDQQIRTDELSTQVRAKNSKLLLRQKQADVLKAQAADERRSIELKKIKISELELHQNAPVPLKPPVNTSAADAELDGLRKDIEGQKGKEAALENELASLSGSKDAVVAQQQALAQEVKDLEQRLEDLQKQKPLAESAADAERRHRYEGMVKEKADLEAKIKDFETKIDGFKAAAQTVGFDLQKKKLVHDIVATDARNEQLRQRITNLREDITVLRDQTARLERKVNFSQGKGRSLW